MNPQLNEKDFFKSLMYSVHSLNFLVQKHLEKLLAEKKLLTYSRYVILFFFSECQNDKDSDSSQCSVAKYLNVTEATISRHISTLLNLKIIQKKVDKENRRKHIIALTEKGSKIFKETNKVVMHELEKVFATVNSSDRHIIIKNFENILQKLTK